MARTRSRSYEPTHRPRPRWPRWNFPATIKPNCVARRQSSSRRRPGASRQFCWWTATHGFAESVDFIDAAELVQTTNRLPQVGSDAIGLGLGVESQPAVALVGVLEVAVGKELVESLAIRRLVGAVAMATPRARIVHANDSDGDRA